MKRWAIVIGLAAGLAASLWFNCRLWRGKRMLEALREAEVAHAKRVADKTVRLRSGSGYSLLDSDGKSRAEESFSLSGLYANYRDAYGSGYYTRGQRAFTFDAAGLKAIHETPPMLGVEASPACKVLRRVVDQIRRQDASWMQRDDYPLDHDIAVSMLTSDCGTLTATAWPWPGKPDRITVLLQWGFSSCPARIDNCNLVGGEQPMDWHGFRPGI